MIKIETLDIQGFGPALHGMRNPKDSWERSDTVEDAEMEAGVVIGAKDMKLALSLAEGGPVHAKYRRMITVWADITAPLYWWKEYDTHKVGTVANSCSTMHRIHAKEFTLDQFSHEHMTESSVLCLQNTIYVMNDYRRQYLDAVAEDSMDAKLYWWQMIQLLPTSYNQKRTVMLNYEVLANICKWRRGHKLDEWRRFIEWAERLPYAELFLAGHDKA